MSLHNYTALGRAISKLGLAASLLGLGACASVDGAAPASLAAGPAPRMVSDGFNSYDTARVPQATVRLVSLSGGMASDPMPYAGRAETPMGFLELCSRSPIECTHSNDYDPQRIRTLARGDMARKYRIAMSGGRDTGDDQDRGQDRVLGADTEMRVAAISNDGDAQPAEQVAANAAPVIDSSAVVGGFVSGGMHRLGSFVDLSVAQVQNPQPVVSSTSGELADAGDASAPGAVSQSRQVLSWGAKGMPSGSQLDASAQASTVVRAVTAVPTQFVQRAQVRDYYRVDMTGQALMLIRAVNDQVNGTMRAATDQQVYGIGDYWNDPALTNGVRGDCEDYALEKRRMLIEHGVPAAALSIAIVRTRRDEEHAVLVVTTTAGDYVLDNLTFDVRPWRRAGYTWISRQGPGDDLTWVSLAPANNAPAMRPMTVYVANAQ